MGVMLRLLFTVKYQDILVYFWAYFMLDYWSVRRVSLALWPPVAGFVVFAAERYFKDGSISFRCRRKWIDFPQDVAVIFRSRPFDRTFCFSSIADNMVSRSLLCLALTVIICCRNLIVAGMVFVFQMAWPCIFWLLIIYCGIQRLSK